jgi:hypothetical protein
MTKRIAITEDGYTFIEQNDGSWDNGDMVFNSLDELVKPETLHFIGAITIKLLDEATA